MLTVFLARARIIAGDTCWLSSVSQGGLFWKQGKEGRAARARTVLQGELFNRERARWEIPAGRAGAVGIPGSVGRAEGKEPTGPSLLLPMAVAPGVLT